MTTASAARGDYRCFDWFGHFENGVGGHCYRERGRRGWEVSIAAPHIAFGERYEHLHVDAVVDDFGDLVLIADDVGAVVMR